MRFGFAPCLVGAGCDPKEPPPVSNNGPPFIVLGRSDQQPADGGTGLYVQARGGNWVGIYTEGCTHSIPPYSGVTYSCQTIPYYSAEALHFTADPENTSCRVDVTVYSICDCLADADLPYLNSASVWSWCDQVGTKIATDFEWVGPPVGDASSEAEAGDAGPSDALGGATTDGPDSGDP